MLTQKASPLLLSTSLWCPWVMHLEADPGFTLDPDVPGNGAWLNTSTYVFTPEPSMNGGTEYTIQINPNLVATSGASLQSQNDPIIFTTSQPRFHPGIAAPR
jgi:hypothetical protein